MTRLTRLQIVGHAVRWANNLIVEVRNNHSDAMSTPCAEAVRKLASTFIDAQSWIAHDIHEEETS